MTAIGSLPLRSDTYFLYEYISVKELCYSMLPYWPLQRRFTFAFSLWKVQQFLAERTIEQQVGVDSV